MELLTDNVGEIPETGTTALERPTFEALFTRYSSYVAAIAIRLMGRDGEVDDIVQDVFLVALRGMDRVRDPGAIRGWLATVTVRMVQRRLRLRRARAFLGLAGREPEVEQVAATGASPEEQAQLTRLYAVLAELPVAERIAWTLRYVEGEQLEAVAAMCGCSLATAKRRILAARRHLAKHIDGAVGDE